VGICSPPVASRPRPIPHRRMMLTDGAPPHPPPGNHGLHNCGLGRPARDAAVGARPAGHDGDVARVAFPARNWAMTSAAALSERQGRNRRRAPSGRRGPAGWALLEATGMRSHGAIACRVQDAGCRAARRHTPAPAAGTRCWHGWKVSCSSSASVRSPAGRTCK
jgi:hypothetical protein